MATLTTTTPIPLPSFTRTRELRSTIFKRPMPLKSRSPSSSSTTTTTTSSSNKYLTIPSTSINTSSYKPRRVVKIAHRQKRCVGSPDSPRIGVEDLQKFAEQYGIPLPSVCEEAVHDTFSLGIAVPKERGMGVVVGVGGEEKGGMDMEA